VIAGGAQAARGRRAGGGGKRTVGVVVVVWLGVCVRVPVSVLDREVVTAAVTDADSDAVSEGVRGGVAVMDPLRVTVEVEVLVCD
jgi:hypothetical protein